MTWASINATETKETTQSGSIVTVESSLFQLYGTNEDLDLASDYLQLEDGYIRIRVSAPEETTAVATSTTQVIEDDIVWQLGTETYDAGDMDNPEPVEYPISISNAITSSGFQGALLLEDATAELLTTENEDGYNAFLYGNSAFELGDVYDDMLFQANVSSYLEGTSDYIYFAAAAYEGAVEPNSTDGTLLTMLLFMPDEETVVSIAEKYELELIQDGDEYYYEFPVSWASIDSTETKLTMQSGTTVSFTSQSFQYYGTDPYTDLSSYLQLEDGYIRVCVSAPGETTTATRATRDSDETDDTNTTTTTVSTEQTTTTGQDIVVSIQEKDNYYISVDDRDFADDLQLATVNGSVEGVDFAYDGYECDSPKELYDCVCEAYCWVELEVLYNGDSTGVTIPVVVGVKGDTNLDGVVSIQDAYQTIQYYVQQATENSVTFADLTENDESLESLMYFLSDVSTESVANENDFNTNQVIDVMDASYILRYYAQEAAGNNPTWTDLIPSLSALSDSYWAFLEADATTTYDAAYVTGNSTITIGTITVTLDELEANDYQVEVPVTVSDCENAMSFGFMLDDDLTYDDYLTRADISSIADDKVDGSYWYAQAAGSQTADTMTLLLTVSEDATAGRTYEITGLLTAPDGSPALVDGEIVSTIVSGSIIIENEETEEPVIGIGKVSVSLDTLKANNYQVNVPISVSCDYKDMTFGVTLGSDVTFVSVTFTNGTSSTRSSSTAVWLRNLNSSSTIPSGEIGYITVQLPSNITSATTYTLSGLSTWSETGQTAQIDGIAATIQSGTIAITSTTSGSGGGSSSTTNNDKKDNSTSETFLKGDVDGDGDVDIVDAALTLEYYAKKAAGVSTWTFEEAGVTLQSEAMACKAANVDENDDIDILDASYILQYYANHAAGIDVTWDDIIG